MQYRTFLSGFLYGCLAVMAFCAVLFVLSSGFQSKRADRGWAPTLVTAKTAYLENTPSPKAVVISGSNGLFGIDTRQLSGMLAVPAYNAASFAALSWPYVDYYALQHLEAGDYAILPLELTYYGGYDRLNSETVLTAHAVGLDYFFSLPVEDKLSYLRLLNGKFVWQQIRDRFVPMLEERRSRYFSYTLQPSGDIDLSAAVPAPAVVEQGAISPPELPGGRITEALCSSIEDMRTRGIHVLVTQPNIYIKAGNIPRYESFMQDAARQVEGCGATFVSVPGHGIMPLEAMLDTGFHLNESGRYRRTRELGQALCEAQVPCDSSAVAGD